MSRFFDIVDRIKEELGWSSKHLAEQSGTYVSYFTQLYWGD